MSKFDNQLKTAIENAEKELNSLEESPFSPSAFEALKGRIGLFISELVTESIRVAKRHSADTVSSSHIEKASDFLVTSSGKRFFRHLGTIGGALIGAGISNILAMTTSSQFSTLGVAVTSGLSIVGAFLIALHIAKD